MIATKIGGAALVAACFACAAGSSAGTGPTLVRSADANVITAAELSDPAVSGYDALTAVQRLRPAFFRTRGFGSVKDSTAGIVHVSVDGGALFTVDYLSGLRTSDLAEVRYLTAIEATQRFGTAAGTGGVILVRSKRTP
jgi:hypothetical protein